MRRSMAMVCAALLWGCSSGLKRPVQEVTASMGSDHVQHVTVKTHSFWFEPNRIVVKAGTPVELEVKYSALFVPHNFSCSAPETGIDVEADVGMFHGSKILRFTPTKPGEYHFHCDVDAHMKKGMTGTLVVQ